MQTDGTTAVQEWVRGGRHSDRSLIAGLSRHDPAALSELYDRYAPLVFTLACGHRPGAAEAIMEQVFVELWRAAAKATPSMPLPRLLIDLTAQQLVPHPARHSRSPESSTGRAVLPGLAPFTDLPPVVFDVVVLASLGQLHVREIAVALDLDQGAVLQSLSAGLARLRSPAIQSY